MERTSESGSPVDPVYDASKLTDFQPEAKPGRPGEYPFTRGAYPRVDVDRPSTMRQYAGFAAAQPSGRRYRQLTEAGTAGLPPAAIERILPSRDRERRLPGRQGN